MDSQDKFYSILVICALIGISVAVTMDYFSTKEKENTKRTMYENWNRFSDIEKAQLLNK